MAKEKTSQIKEGVEFLKADLWRSRRWTLALGWLALVYGLLALVQVALTVLMLSGLFEGFSDFGYGLLTSFGSSFISVIGAFLIIPLGIVLIRAGYDIIPFISDTDFTSLLSYQHRIRTASILAVTILIIHLLSLLVMAFGYAVAFRMPGFISPG